MAQHDHDIGKLLNKLDELGIADNTIVIYSTDNGAQKFTWPDGGTIPFRGEKGTTWEGGFRVPAMVRWPGVVKPGTIINDIFSHEDWVPTLMAAAGDPKIKEKLKKSLKVGDKTFKTHLDGYDQTDLLTGNGPGSRNEIFYFDAGGNLNAVRYKQWKLHFTIMEGSINEAYRKSPSWPLVTSLRQDPFEVTPDAALYTRWHGDQMWMFVPAQAYVTQFLKTFIEYPPSQAVGSLSVEKVLQKMQQAAARQ
jgi:arylsulfatase